MANERILIIEDDQQLADELQIYLTELGYQIQTARRDLDVVNHVMQEALPALILLGTPVASHNIFSYPLLDPISEAFWDSTRSNYIPIIFMGVRDDGNPSLLRIDGPEYDGVDSITKPMDFEELKIRIKNRFSAIERWKEQDARWERKSKA